MKIVVSIMRDLGDILLLVLPSMISIISKPFI